MVVAVVVDDLAVDAHILDTTVLIHDDVVVRPCAGHATGEDVGSTVIVLVPVHDLSTDAAHTTLVLADINNRTKRQWILSKLWHKTVNYLCSNSLTMALNLVESCEHNAGRSLMLYFA